MQVSVIVGACEIECFSVETPVWSDNSILEVHNPSKEFVPAQRTVHEIELVGSHADWFELICSLGKNSSQWRMMDSVLRDRLEKARKVASALSSRATASSLEWDRWG
jgi:hypothetical protein